MKVYHLGLIILGIVIILTIISSYKDETKEEAFDVDVFRENRKKRVKQSSKIWQSRIYPRIKGTDGSSMKILEREGFEDNKEESKLKEVNPTAEAVNTAIQTNIQQCSLINTADDCSLLKDADCGYCVSTNTIAAGDKNGPYVGGCITADWKKGQPEDGEWLAPTMKDKQGRGVDYYCRKKKEQKICKKMKNCGDNGGEKSICAWCPATGTGVPYKIDSDGGLVPKYDDDKCEWVEDFKNKKYPTTKTKYLGWTPSKGGYPKRGKLRKDKTMIPAPKPFGAPLDVGEGDCDTDADCGYNKFGQKLKCGHDGRGLKRIVNSNGQELKPNAGYKDYCYDPHQFPFKGSLIKAEDCKRFGQMFPCVGPNMRTGPHSDACLKDLWRDSGCRGNVFDRNKSEDIQNWNSNGYKDVGQNMYNINVTAKTSKNFKSANEANNRCYGQNLDPCDRQRNFTPRPDECSQKLYDSTGCSINGKLNPKNIKGVSSYVSDNWIRDQKGGITQNQYKRKLYEIKSKSRSGLINPDMSTFDDTMDANIQCFGKNPNIPFEKPCFKEFILIMKCVKGVKKISGFDEDTDVLSFDDASELHSLLPEGKKDYWKSNFTWVSDSSKGRYLIDKKLYEKEYFPFWNFVTVSKSYWKNNWNEFVSRLVKSREITAGVQKVNAKWFDWTPKNKYPLKKGEGDCDNDSHCAPGLKCAENPGSLPGINNNGQLYGGRDFCYDPMDAIMEGNKALKFTQKSQMISYVGIRNNKTAAEREGKFWNVNNNLYLTKTAYQNENFPYWSFLNAAEMLGY